MPIATDNHASTALAKVSTDIAGMDAMSLASILVESGYFQDTRQVAQAAVKVLAGREIGFGPIASMQGIFIVKNRVTHSSNIVAAAIQRSGRFRYRVTRLDKTGCTMMFYERIDGQWEELGESRFDPQDAADAGLTTNSTYKAFPRNMYFARALTNGARWYTPEVFNGPVYTPDELGAVVDADGQVIDIPAAPPIDTDTTAEDAAKYNRIYRQGGDSTYDLPEMVTDPESKMWRRWLQLNEEAFILRLGVPVLELPVNKAVLIEAGQTLFNTIEDAKKPTEEDRAEVAGTASAPQGRAAESPPAAPRPAGDLATKVTSKNDPLWKEYLEAEKAARMAGLPVETFDVHLPTTEEKLSADIANVRDMTLKAQAEQDTEPAAVF